jgi:hypothetical protein
MPLVLISLGVVIALAGIGSIAAGAPSWVLGLGLGSALIQSGAVGLVGGFLLVGIGFVLRSLRDLSRRIDGITAAPMMPAGPVTRAPVAAPTPRMPVPAKREMREPREPGRREPPPFAGRPEARPEIAPRAEMRPDAKAPPLFERDEMEDFPEPALGDRRPPRPRLAEPELRPAPRNRPRPPAPAERAPVYEDEYEEEPLAPVGADGMSTTVVRSGIIGGMAYTLYTDGSIEAELPIGTVRFASIEELQDHVSQTGEDADVDFGGSHAPKN